MKSTFGQLTGVEEKHLVSGDDFVPDAGAKYPAQEKVAGGEDKRLPFFVPVHG